MPTGIDHDLWCPVCNMPAWRCGHKDFLFRKQDPVTITPQKINASQIADGAITQAKIANIIPSMAVPEIVEVLPILPDPAFPEDKIVFLNNKLSSDHGCLFRNIQSTWVKGQVPPHASDLVFGSGKSVNVPNYQWNSNQSQVPEPPAKPTKEAPAPVTRRERKIALEE